MKKIDIIIFLSDKIDMDRFYDAYVIDKLGLNRKKKVIPNFIPKVNLPSVGYDVIERFQLPSKYFVCISNFQMLKNQELIIEAICKVQFANLVLVGGYETKYLDKLRERVKLLGLASKVTFIVGASHDDSMRILKNAYCFVLSSLTECMPLCILESIGFGVPVISSDVGCISDIKGIVTYKTEEEMVTIMKKMYMDKSYYGKTCEEIEFAKVHLSEDNILRKFKSVIKEQLNNVES